MRPSIVSIVVSLVFALVSVSAGQLTPAVMLDRYLVQAARLITEQDYPAALDALDQVIILERRHGLVLPDEFHFQYATVAFAAGSLEAAMDAVNRYFSSAGTTGEFYREALELWSEVDSAQRRVEAEVEYESLAANRVEALRSRADDVPTLPAATSTSRRDLDGPAVFLLGYDSADVQELGSRCSGIRVARSLTEASVLVFKGGWGTVANARGDWVESSSRLEDICGIMEEFRESFAEGTVGVRPAMRNIQASPALFMIARPRPTGFLRDARHVFTFEERETFARECTAVEVTRDLSQADVISVSAGGQGNNWVWIYDLTSGRMVKEIHTFRRGTAFRELCEHFRDP